MLPSYDSGRYVLSQKNNQVFQGLPDIGTALVLHCKQLNAVYDSLCIVPYDSFMSHESACNKHALQRPCGLTAPMLNLKRPCQLRATATAAGNETSSCSSDLDKY